MRIILIIENVMMNNNINEFKNVSNLLPDHLFWVVAYLTVNSCWEMSDTRLENNALYLQHI